MEEGAGSIAATPQDVVEDMEENGQEMCELQLHAKTLQLETLRQENALAQRAIHQLDQKCKVLDHVEAQCASFADAVLDTTIARPPLSDAPSNVDAKMCAFLNSEITKTEASKEHSSASFSDDVSFEDPMVRTETTGRRSQRRLLGCEFDVMQNAHTHGYNDLTEWSFALDWNGCSVMNPIRVKAGLTVKITVDPNDVIGAQLGSRPLLKWENNGVHTAMQGLFIVELEGFLEVTGITLEGEIRIGDASPLYELANKARLDKGEVGLSAKFTDCVFTKRHINGISGEYHSVVISGARAVFEDCKFYPTLVQPSISMEAVKVKYAVASMKRSEFSNMTLAIYNIGGKVDLSDCTFAGFYQGEGRPSHIPEPHPGIFPEFSSQRVSIVSSWSSTTSCLGCTFSNVETAFEVGKLSRASCIACEFTDNNSSNPIKVNGDNSMTVINPVKLQSQTLNKFKNCSNPTLCAENLFPGRICVDANLTSVPPLVKCDPDPSIALINGIAPTNEADCTNDHPDKPLHLNGCNAGSSALSIKITGEYFEQNGSGANRVTIAGVDCTIKLWSASQIVCVVNAELTPIGTDLEVFVYTKNGKQSSNSPERILISYAPPTISNVIPDRVSVGGGDLVTFVGTNFGLSSRSEIVITYDGNIGAYSASSGSLAFSSVSHVSDTRITAVSPPLSNHNGILGLLALSIGGQKVEANCGAICDSCPQRESSINCLLRYKAPTLIAASTIDQEAKNRLVLTGTEFGDDSRVWGRATGLPDIECDGVEVVSTTELTCEWPLGGAGGCTQYMLSVEVGGQNSNQSLPLCYEEDARAEGCTVLEAPDLDPDTWRADHLSLDMCKYPIYSCPHAGACLGIEASNASASQVKCRDGHNNSSPLCAICSEGFVLLGQSCTECEHRQEEVPSGLFILIAFIAVAYCLAAIKFLVKAANSEDEVKRAGKVLSHIVFEVGRKKDLTSTEFQEIAALQENLHLTLSQISLLFRNILAEADEDERSSTNVKNAVSTDKIKMYLGYDVNGDHDADKDNIGPNDIESQGHTATNNENKAEESSGGDKLDSETIAEQVELVQHHSQKIGDDNMGEIELVNLGAENSLPTIQIPPIKLMDFPGLDLSSLTLPESFLGKIDVGKLGQIQFPGISLVDIKTPQFEFGLLSELFKNMSTDIFADLQIPSVRVRHMLPNVDLSAILPGLLGLPRNGVDFDFDALREFLLDIELPSFRLGDFPGIKLPSVPALPNLDMNLPDVKLPSGGMSLPNVNLQRIGGLLMKVKLLIGFVQCLSFIPSTLSMVPWPDTFVDLSRILQLASIDVFSAFGNLCDFSTRFSQKFVAQMVILPFGIGISVVAYLLVVIVLSRLSPDMVRQTTKESLRTRLFELNFLVVYTLYTSVSTSIFRLFDCQEVQGSWYLSADFTMKCFGPEWNSLMAVAVLGVIVYTIGIPFVLFVLLRRSRHHLYADECPRGELSRHAIVKKKLGAVYKDCESFSPLLIFIHVF